MQHGHRAGDRPDLSSGVKVAGLTEADNPASTRQNEA